MKQRGIERHAGAILGAWVVSACAVTPQSPALPQGDGVVLCQSEAAAIITSYDTARADDCDVRSARNFVLTIRPEAFENPDGSKINNSPWYGFKVAPRGPGAVNVELQYEGGTHRYHPKTSQDGRAWSRLPDSAIKSQGDAQITLTLGLDKTPLFVSAQEMITPAMHDAFTDRIGQRDDAFVSVIGRSARGTPLRQIDLQTDPNASKPYVVLVGRQHPPEVTGALALMHFTDAVLEDTALARKFREHFNLLVIPMINPDGVEDGNWRFATGGLDLNRDWGPFTQPETRAVRSALNRFHSGADEVVFFLDFHSTRRNLLYTQTDAEPTNPPLFTRDWVAAVKSRLSDDIYPFTREDRPNSGRPISKNYMYESFGIPAITYEVGDETPRDAIETSATIFAEEMMRLLIERADE